VLKDNGNEYSTDHLMMWTSLSIMSFKNGMSTTSADI